MTHKVKLLMNEIMKMTQMAWETVITSKTTVPASVNTEVAHRPTTSKNHRLYTD